MALLSVLSMLAAVALVVLGREDLVLLALLAFGLCLLFAPVLERLVISLDDAAARALATRGRGSANPVAIACGALPVAVLLAWETFALVRFGPRPGNRDGLRWLLSYGVATGPWTAFTMRVSRFRRTLVGIRAYAGHLAYWLLSAAVLLLHAPLGLAAMVMILPAILPVTVGVLLALADREALKNVRV